jgi:carbon monoxide dehydrogenase subunit G
MKKFLKIVGIIIAVIIVLVLVTGLFAKKDYNIERSITINAPKEKVWDHVSTLANTTKWSPWLKQDPNTKLSYQGQDGTVGSVFKWESEKVGTGNQTFTKLEAPNRTESHIQFIKPFTGEADVFMQLQEEGAATKATWGFSTHYGYPMNVMPLLFNMTKMMEESYDDGLKQLKALSESN